MAFEHEHHDEVQVDQLVALADTYAQVEEWLATIRVSVTCQRHGPNQFMVKDSGNLQQRNNDQDAHVLTDDAVIEASKFRHLHAILGFLDGYRHLSKWQTDADIVHGQVEA